MIAYALAGRVDIDFETEPVGFGNDNEPVFLRDIWPNQVFLLAKLFIIILSDHDRLFNDELLILLMKAELQHVEKKFVIPSMFDEVYKSITSGESLSPTCLSHIPKNSWMLNARCFPFLGNERWNKLQAPQGVLYPWDATSTYIKSPPFFEGMDKDLPPAKPIKDSYVLLNLGDSVTTDHISPAGNINRNSPAAR